LAFVGAASCREHRELCQGEGCGASKIDDTTPGSSGSAGSFIDPDEPSGAGGADARPACSRDADCDDGLACDGVEPCVSGRCEPGALVECASGTHCVEDGAERCVYENSSPWLVAMTKERVMALRLAELAAGETTLIPLLERPRDRAFLGFAGAFWAPNGRFALVPSVEPEFGSSYQLLQFGAGLPAIGDVPDLPNWGDYSDPPQFMPDSSQARLFDNYSGSYVVDFTREPPVTQRHPLGDFYWTTGGCSDGKSWVRVDHDYRVSVDTVEDGTATARTLGEFYSLISPDGAQLLLTTHSTAETPQVVLTHCSDDPWTFEIKDAFHGEFSPNSKLLWLKLNGGGLRVLSLEDPSAPVEVWARSTADDVDGERFTPDGRRLLFEQAEGDSEPTVHVVDLEASPEPEARDLGLSAGVKVFYAGDTAALVIDSTAEGGVRYLLQSLSTPEPPRLVLEGTAEQSIELSHGFLEEGSFFVQRTSDPRVELLKLQITPDRFELTALATFEGVDIAGPEIAPDQSGVTVGASTNFIDNKLYWIALPPGGPAGEPQLLLERTSWWGFQREQP
jgi:hypothetical protein